MWNTLIYTLPLLLMLQGNTLYKFHKRNLRHVQFLWIIKQMWATPRRCSNRISIFRTALLFRSAGNHACLRAFATLPWKPCPFRVVGCCNLALINMQVMKCNSSLHSFENLHCGHTVINISAQDAILKLFRCEMIMCTDTPVFLYSLKEKTRFSNYSRRSSFWPSNETDIRHIL